MRGAGEGNSLSFETSSSVLELLGVSPFQFSTHCRNWANQGGGLLGQSSPVASTVSSSGDRPGFPCLSRLLFGHGAATALRGARSAPG